MRSPLRLLRLQVKELNCSILASFVFEDSSKRAVPPMWNVRIVSCVAVRRSTVRQSRHRLAYFYRPSGCELRP